MTGTYVNVWRRVQITHACAGDGRTLCGVDCVGDYDEGALFDADEADTYVTCAKCLRSIEKRAAFATPRAEQGGQEVGNG